MHLKVNIRIALMAGLGWAMPVSSPAQDMRAPLPLEQIATVYDQTLAKPLRSDGGGSLVHVLRYGSQIMPPSPDGEPHAENTVLFTTRVGAGVDPDELPGAFVDSIIPRPVEPFFVRVYNAPNIGASTFYADSNVYTPSLAVDETCSPTMVATTNAIDASDADGDGISTSWEQSLGFDASASDSDGDSVADGIEVLMGTDPLDAASVVPVFVVGVSDNALLTAHWDQYAEPVTKYDALQNVLMNQPGMASNPYSNMIYRMQGSASLTGPWQTFASGAIYEWPAQKEIPASTNDVKFYRVIVDRK